MKQFLVIAVCAIIGGGCSNPFSSEDRPPPLPDVWFVTNDGVKVMSEYPDEMLTRLYISTDSLGNLIDTWNRRVQRILHDSLAYDQQYLSSPDLKVLFASLDYINQWNNREKRITGLYIRTEKVAMVPLWWDMCNEDARYCQGIHNDIEGLLWLSRRTLIHELTHYYQHRSRKTFSSQEEKEDEAERVTWIFFQNYLEAPADMGKYQILNKKILCDVK
ncbi:hypothetical protein MYX07_01875 [Patescibacteria group bacterium AH-259-L07]|nr:hypothetical protein [Patescibacteria group bacterium AH-259-L07]